MAPRMQKELVEDGMLELIVVVAGTLLLVTAGTVRRPAPQPVRNRRNNNR